MNIKKRELTKKAIIDSAVELIKRDGVSSVSISELSSKANVSRVTFYRYFNNVEEVIDEQVKLYYADLRELLVNVDANNEQDNERLIDEITNRFLDYKEFFKMLINNNMQHKMHIGLAKVVDEFSDKSSPDPKIHKYMVTAYTASFISILIRYIMKEDISRDELAHIIKTIDNIWK